MTEIICPICGRPNPTDLDECQYCQAPLKTSGFIIPSEGQDELSQPASPPDKEAHVGGEEPKPESLSPLEQAIPDWLKQTEAKFLKRSETEPEETTADQVSEQIESLLSETSSLERAEGSAIDEEWLASLVSGAGATKPAAPASEEATSGAELGAAEVEVSQPPSEAEAEEQPPLSPESVEKPEWVTSLEADSTFKLESAMPSSKTGEEDIGIQETKESEAPTGQEIPEWVKKPDLEVSPPSPMEPEPQIVPAELPGWLEALRPIEAVSPTEPVEDVSAADMVTAGPLVGLRGVISAHPSAIRARKPPTYSIKLRVTDEQRTRMEMMEELLAEEQKPKPLPSPSVISPRNIFRYIIALVLILPIAWMIIARSQRTSAPQPGNIPGVVDFTRQIQKLPAGEPVLLAFDYEAGFSGEMNVAISALINQLMIRNTYLTLITTNPSGPALAESLLNNLSINVQGSADHYSNYTDLGYIPGGTMGLLGLATSPKAVVPYSINGDNVWAIDPLNKVTRIQDFSAVIVMTNDPDTARIWIEQVGTFLQPDHTPLLIITSSQAEPLINPYYEATPAQVQGLVAGIAGGLAYSRTISGVQQNGLWDAFSIGITVSILIIVIGSLIGVVIKMIASGKQA